MVPSAGQRQDGEGLGGLPGGQCDSCNSPFQGGDPLFQDVLGGVVDARVDVAGFREGEQIGRMLGVAEDERRGLVDRHGTRAGRRVGDGAGVDLLGLEGPRGLRGRILVVVVLGVCPAVTESMGWLMTFLAR